MTMQTVTSCNVIVLRAPQITSHCEVIYAHSSTQVASEREPTRAERRLDAPKDLKLGRSQGPGLCLGLDPGLRLGLGLGPGLGDVLSPGLKIRMQIQI